MPRSLNVHFLPGSVTAADLADRDAVVIDVLRATTTIVQALSMGAECIWPCQTVEQARTRAAEIESAGFRPLLAGERECLRVAGFDLGNSPAEYTEEITNQREIVFTTTNGTAAMLRCVPARRILIASFTNLSALVRLLEAADHIVLVCSGTNGQLTREDVLLAGAIVGKLSERGEFGLNDAAHIADSAWRDLGLAGEIANQSAKLAKTLESSLGGRNLVRVGSSGDLVEAARIDRWSVVPEFDASTGRIGRLPG